MPINVVLIKKGGEISSAKVNDVEPNTLAKKCGFKTPNGFQKQTTWPLSKESGTVIELWAKSDGRAGSENKYDFPPPVDNALFFSTCCLVAKRVDAGTSVDVEPEEWARLYEKLFGGFHNLADTALEDEEEEDELADLPAEMKTKHGYLKDDFIVDDHTSSVECSINGSVTPSLTGSEDDYESELDFEDYEYMDSSEAEEESSEEEQEEQ